MITLSLIALSDFRCTYFFKLMDIRIHANKLSETGETGETGETCQTQF
jgi:hypothetical protein